MSTANAIIELAMMRNLYKGRTAAVVMGALLPMLLILPAFHIHIEPQHQHGTDGVHRHHVVHADFLPGSERDHARHSHHDEQSGQDCGNEHTQWGLCAFVRSSAPMPALSDREQSPLLATAYLEKSDHRFSHKHTPVERQLGPPLEHWSTVTPRAPPQPA